MPIKEILASLNRNGILWKDGTPWTESRVYRVVTSEVYLGYRRDYFSNEWKRGEWEPIISPDLFHAVRGDSVPWWVGYPDENERERPATLRGRAGRCSAPSKARGRPGTPYGPFSGALRLCTRRTIVSTTICRRIIFGCKLEGSSEIRTARTTPPKNPGTDELSCHSR